MRLMSDVNIVFHAVQTVGQTSLHRLICNTDDQNIVGSKVKYHLGFCCPKMYGSALLFMVHGKSKPTSLNRMVQVIAPLFNWR